MVSNIGVRFNSPNRELTLISDFRILSASSSEESDMYALD